MTGPSRWANLPRGKDSGGRVLNRGEGISGATGRDPATPVMQQISPTRETLVETLGKERESALQKYRAMHVGDGASLLAFLRYELLTFFLSSLPGAAGYFLRKATYGRLFDSVGRGVVIGPRVTFRCPRSIALGNNVFIDANAVLDAKGAGSRIRLRDSVLIGRNSILSCASATISLGEDVSIGPNCYIRAGLGDVELGSYITIGANSVIISGNPSYARSDIPMKRQIGSAEGVTIGDDVWMGVGVRVVDGVHVGHGCVIGAGAVVIDDLPDGSIAAGVPARVIGRRDGYGDVSAET